MISRSPTVPLALWSSAYAGCLLFLLAELIPHAWLSLPLLGQLCWLAAIGSIPTTLLLGAAVRAAQARPPVVVATTIALALLTVAVGWEHTDFLLSGPGWALHPQRTSLRAMMAAFLGLLGATGWLWLVAGMRIERRQSLVVWSIVTAAAVALLATTMARYRAYDYSMAQLVLPAGLLSAAILFLLVRRRRYGFVVFGIAAAGLALASVSRFVPSLAETGQRALIAHSRAGALVTLYVLPQLDAGPSWSTDGQPCPDPRPFVEDTPIGIPPEARRNVILVTVDALRNDVVDTVVGGRPLMPALSRLSRRGVSFQNATSTYPATLFAVGSAFTGLSPAELYLSPTLPETIFTRAQTHVDRQLAVFPDVSWFRLPIVGQFLAPGVEIDFAPTDRAATELIIERLRGARAEDASVMAWVHYYSPHDPYVSRPRFGFGTDRKSAYLGEAAYFDAQLGRLFAYLEEDGWLDDSLVVFFSDHGEALGENGYWGHHVYLNGWMIDVPLVLWHADLAPARPVVGASLADVAPTVLHFLGLPIPSDIPAKSLFMLDADRSGRASFSEAFPVRGRELFDSFRLPGLEEATIRDRIESIRIANKGYEPKGAVTRDGYRLGHHRAADAWLLYERGPRGAERPIHGEPSEAHRLLQSELRAWERAQLRRIECRLRIKADRPATTNRR
ncbi:MAG TPA: sulfatase [Polyangiales bacterium]|nr:sulfatase [Polyangiales bacterium]